MVTAPLSRLARRFPLFRRAWEATFGRPKAAPADLGAYIIDRFAQSYPDAIFVQVGANDGTSFDPLHAAIISSRWRGLMLEPVPAVFERLSRTYAPYRDRIQPINAALTAQEGSIPFYHLREVDDDEAPHLPPWYNMLGSFRRDVILRHADQIPDIEQRVVTKDVACTTFERLVADHGVPAVDLLQLDVEGYDATLLQAIDFGRYKPRLVIYERRHLGDEEHAALRRMLSSHGYECLAYGYDMYCVRVSDARGRDKPFLRVWRDLTRSLRERV